MLSLLWDLHQPALHSSLHVCILNQKVAVLLTFMIILTWYPRQNELACLGVLVAHHDFGSGAIGFLWAHFAKLDVEFMWTKEHLALGVLWPPLYGLLGAITLGDSENAAASKSFLLVIGFKIDWSAEWVSICPQRWQDIEAQLQLAQVALFPVPICWVGDYSTNLLDEQEIRINILAAKFGRALNRLVHRCLGVDKSWWLWLWLISLLIHQSTNHQFLFKAEIPSKLQARSWLSSLHIHWLRAIFSSFFMVRRFPYFNIDATRVVTLPHWCTLTAIKEHLREMWMLTDFFKFNCFCVNLLLHLSEGKVGCWCLWSTYNLRYQALV